MVIATTNDTVCSTAGGTPKRSNTGDSRWLTAGSPTRPSTIEPTVMPNWAPYHRGFLAGPDDRHRAVLVHLFGQCLQPVAARRDQGELGADEERVGRDQQQREQDSEKVAPIRPAPPRRPVR